MYGYSRKVVSVSLELNFYGIGFREGNEQGRLLSTDYHSLIYMDRACLWFQALCHGNRLPLDSDLLAMVCVKDGAHEGVI